MVAQKGKDLLLKIDNGGTYETVAGLRSKSCRSTPRRWISPMPRAPGGGASLRRRRPARRAFRFRPVQGSCFGRTDPNRLFNGSILSWQIVIPDFGTVSGAFQVSALDYGGEHNGEVTFDIALESAGVITFGVL